MVDWKEWGISIAAAIITALIIFGGLYFGWTALVSGTAENSAPEPAPPEPEPTPGPAPTPPEPTPPEAEPPADQELVPAPVTEQFMPVSYYF